MYRAVRERDESYLGVFFLGVRTTGVFCRPGCPARLPRRENVAFFATAEEAELAGFRACRRCHPLASPGAHPGWVQQLIARVDASDERIGGAWSELQRGAGIDDAGLGAGWESTSGFRDAFERVFGEPPGRGRASARLVSDLFATPLGPMIAVAGERGLCLLEFGDRRALPAQGRALKRWFEGSIVPGRNEHLDRAERELEEYFAGARSAFDVPLELPGTPFQVEVWNALLRIPCGETRSYGELARDLGRPGAQRAVGRANGQNRIGVIVPCHRVVESTGALRGYGGGLWRKQRLLELEQSARPRQ